MYDYWFRISHYICLCVENIHINGGLFTYTHEWLPMKRIGHHLSLFVQNKPLFMGMCTE